MQMTTLYDLYEFTAEIYPDPVPMSLTYSGEWSVRMGDMQVGKGLSEQRAIDEAAVRLYGVNVARIPDTDINYAPTFDSYFPSVDYTDFILLLEPDIHLRHTVSQLLFEIVKKYPEYSLIVHGEHLWFSRITVEFWYPSWLFEDVERHQKRFAKYDDLTGNVRVP